MLVMKINKELGTKECIEYGDMLSKHLGEKVVILDSKVKEFYRLEDGYLEYPYCSDGICTSDTVDLKDGTYNPVDLKDYKIDLKYGYCRPFSFEEEEKHLKAMMKVLNNIMTKYPETHFKNCDTLEELREYIKDLQEYVDLSREL